MVNKTFVAVKSLVSGLHGILGNTAEILQQNKNVLSCRVSKRINISHVGTHGKVGPIADRHWTIPLHNKLKSYSVTPNAARYTCSM